MKLAYIVKDDKGNVGQSIPLTKGESRIITVFLFDSNGVPFSYSGTITEIDLKIFSTISVASIRKKLSLSEVTAITQAGPQTSNLIGFQFSLSAANTNAMAANNSGLPMTATITDSGTNVLELDFLEIFKVTDPVVLT